MVMSESDRLISRIKELTGRQLVRPPKIVTDTSDAMRIERDHIMRFDGMNFIIEGNRYETRFGISDQPKYWVFSAIDLKTGEKKIIKTVFHEDFHVHIGVFKIHCYRSPEKEAKILELVRGDTRFMQGYTFLDEKGNNVRVIDFIPGKSIFNFIYEINKSHEEYFVEDLPDILRQLVSCIEAIKYLHEHGFCHGDIRNDHILIDAKTGQYRWIDYDLKQHVSDFDVWSMGNIVNYAVGKGINSFKNVFKSKHFSDAIKGNLTGEDASAFYEYRVMNLQKLYPYIPDNLNNILNHFTVRPKAPYQSLSQLLDDYKEMLMIDFPKT